ncbi:hypothetical protein ISG33_12310 [Glaciecola sp. MH2013]|uniref:hypothetical protein n=1 Tax=Glaciecola sp. MH2013 TaxID=2785524 RepID=UPI00189E1729|nr:hypothetical protein [Glaciecola sp. MH2013]MBF7074184.1 hypothetical protein [Glaciecola sp. MH2013]
MSQVSNFWPTKSNLRCSYIISYGERLLGRPIKGAGLALLYHWLDRFSSKWGQKKQIVSAIVFVLALLAVLAGSLIVDHYSKDEAHEESISKSSDCYLEVCSSEVSKKSSSQVFLQSNPNQNQKIGTLADVDFSNMSPEDLDKYFAENNFSDVSVVSTTTLIKERFEGLNLFERESVLDWDQYLVELEQLSHTDPFAVPGKIYTALTNKAPFEVVEEIVLNGHKLTGIDISALAMYLNVEQIQKLENYGVDLSLSTSASGSAIVNSLFHEDGPSMFEYLIGKEELVLSTEFDVVKEVLVMSYNLKRPPTYAKKLIERGAVLSEDAKSWVESELKTKDPRYYSLVKANLNI